MDTPHRRGYRQRRRSRVDGARADSGVSAGPGSVLDFNATFAAQPFQHVGFANDFNDPPWAMFSTGGGTLPVGLYARTWDGTTRHATHRSPASIPPSPTTTRSMDLDLVRLLRRRHEGRLGPNHDRDADVAADQRLQRGDSGDGRLDEAHHLAPHIQIVRHLHIAGVRRRQRVHHQDHADPLGHHAEPARRSRMRREPAPPPRPTPRGRPGSPSARTARSPARASVTCSTARSSRRPTRRRHPRSTASP